MTTRERIALAITSALREKGIKPKHPEGNTGYRSDELQAKTYLISTINHAVTKAKEADPDSWRSIPLLDGKTHNHTPVQTGGILQQLNDTVVCGHKRQANNLRSMGITGGVIFRAAELIYSPDESD